MKSPRGVGPNALLLKLVLLEFMYQTASIYYGVVIFISMSVWTSDDRKLARDMQASLRGEFREGLPPSVINKATTICAQIRRTELRFEGRNRMMNLILEPMRRNLVENREMLEDAIETWRAKLVAEAANF